jgi:hypothetical protein
MCNASAIAWVGAFLDHLVEDLELACGRLLVDAGPALARTADVHLARLCRGDLGEHRPDVVDPFHPREVFADRPFGVEGGP